MSQLQEDKQLANDMGKRYKAALEKTKKSQHPGPGSLSRKESDSDLEAVKV